MKTFCSLVILAGMAITFVVLSALAQEAKAPDPKVREQFVALQKSSMTLGIKTMRLL
jgi:hypothetical protein